MSFKPYNIITLFLLVVILAGAVIAEEGATSRDNLEYKIKAAFIYNFIKFVDWPQDHVKGDTVTIGIIGKSPFNSSFEPITKKKVKDKHILIKYFPQFEEINDKESLKKCHVLYICDSEEEHLNDILNIVKKSCVLTVGEKDGLLDIGGIIRFTMHQKKVRFEINLIAAKHADLEVRSQLLRLAHKVIKEQGKAKGKS